MYVGTLPLYPSPSLHPSLPPSTLCTVYRYTSTPWHILYLFRCIGLTLASTLLSPVSNLLSPVCHLISPVCNLISPVCNLLSHVCNLLSPYCNLLSPVCNLLSPVWPANNYDILIPIACILQNPASILWQPPACIWLPSACMYPAVKVCILLGFYPFITYVYPQLWLFNHCPFLLLIP